MFLNNDKISISQMVSIIILTIVGSGILTLPRELIEVAGSDGWLILIVGGLTVIGVSLVHGYIIRSFPGKSFFQILTLTLTKPIAYIVGIYTIVYFIGGTGYIIRIFAMTVNALLLPQTPPELTGLAVLLISAYLGRQGIEVLGRMAEFIIIPLSVVTLALFMLSWGHAQPSNLLPVLQTSPFEIIRGIPVVLFSFLGFELLLIFGGFIDKPKKSTKVGAIAIVMVLLLYQILNASTLVTLGQQQTKELLWPVINTFKSIELPGAFIEDVQVVVITLWIVTIFMTIAPFHLGATLLTMELAGGKEHSYYALLPLPFIGVVAAWDTSIADVYESLGTFSDYTVYGVILLVPLGILISMIIRGRKNKEDKVA
ncbi:GerAB/ArcD/ProY family transporter [Natronincola ferrireducens]|nr:endospore germination permease [Natronincola ferrireducens]